MASRRHNKSKHPKNQGQHAEKRPEQPAMSKDSKSKQCADCKCKQPKEPKPGPFWLFGQSDPVAGFTGYIAFFTLLLMLVSGIQVWAFVQSERAFATVTAIQFSDGGLVPNKEVSMLVHIGNSGKGTAFITGANLTAIFPLATERFPEKPGYLEGGNIHVGPILANGSTRVRADMRDSKGQPHKVFTADEIKLIMDGTRKVYVFGYISYTDDFSIFSHRMNGFCGLYNPENNPNTPFESCGVDAYTYSR